MKTRTEVDRRASRGSSRARRAGAALALAGLALAARVHGGKPEPKGNDCAEPYWADTLRCRAFPGDPPQPNWDEAPTAAGLKDFTRVFLPKYSVRALDGTRPILYVDKAVCTNVGGCGETAFGEPVESNDWLLSMTGGGACQALDSDEDGRMDDASSCLDLYTDATERDEMGTPDKPAMKNLQGIMDPDPVANPVFARFHRIRIEKVSYDRYNGVVKFRRKGGYFSGVTPASVPVQFDLYQQGFRVLKETLRALDKGLVYTTWKDDGSGGVEEVEESLPSIRAASRVVFVGHSGGAHGLYHNIDRLAEILSKKKDFAGDVRAVFDANFLPSPSSEAAFADDAMGAPIAGDLYSDDWAGSTSAGGIDFDYDGESYWQTGDLARQYEAWGGDKFLDRSCLETHRRTDGATWKCRDRIHVVANHLSTPFFFREDFQDPNVEHTASGIGHFLAWGDFGPWAHCPPDSDCPPYFSLAEHRDRLVEQASTLLDDHAIRSEMALGLDDSLGGGGAFPSFYAWMPACGTHEGTYDQDSWDAQSIAWQSVDWTLREWLEDFLDQPPLGVSASRIDGEYDGATTATSSCPP